MAQQNLPDNGSPSVVDMMDEAQLRAEVMRLSHALVSANRAREDRTGMPMIGGADVCTTCAAHCNVMDEDESEIERLSAEIETLRRHHNQHCSCGKIL